MRGKGGAATGASSSPRASCDGKIIWSTTMTGEAIQRSMCLVDLCGTSWATWSKSNESSDARATCPGSRTTPCELVPMASSAGYPRGWPLVDGSWADATRAMFPGAVLPGGVATGGATSASRLGIMERRAFRLVRPQEDVLTKVRLLGRHQADALLVGSPTPLRPWTGTSRL